jgi:hypothetical protein
MEKQAKILSPSRAASGISADVISAACLSGERGPNAFRTTCVSAPSEAASQECSKHITRHDKKLGARAELSLSSYAAGRGEL